MAWPSGTKASTANVDAGTDLLSLARPDIKQNIDNVNTIIDEFNIASPNNGDLMQYSTSSGKWEPVSANDVGAVNRLAVLAIQAGEELVTGNTYRRFYDVKVDPNNIITEDSAGGGYTFELAAGTYYAEAVTVIVDDSEAQLTIHNETDNSTAITFVNDEIGTTADSFLKPGPEFGIVTIADTKTFSFRQTNSNNTNRNMAGVFKIIKLS